HVRDGRDWLGVDDGTAGDQARAALVLAGKDIDGVARLDTAAAIHRLLGGQVEGCGIGVGDGGLDDIAHGEVLLRRAEIRRRRFFASNARKLRQLACLGPGRYIRAISKSSAWPRISAIPKS